MIPQAFPLYVTIRGEEYLVVAWTDYYVPVVVPLDAPTKAKGGVPRPDAELTYSQFQRQGADLR